MLWTLQLQISYMKKVLEYLGRFFGGSQGNRFFFLSKSLQGLSSGKSLIYFNRVDQEKCMVQTQDIASITRERWDCLWGLLIRFL